MAAVAFCLSTNFLATEVMVSSICFFSSSLEVSQKTRKVGTCSEWCLYPKLFLVDLGRSW